MALESLRQFRASWDWAWNLSLGLTGGPSKAALKVGGRCCCRQGPLRPALLTRCWSLILSAMCPPVGGCGSLAQEADITSGRSGLDFAFESGCPDLHWGWGWGQGREEAALGIAEGQQEGFRGV